MTAPDAPERSAGRSNRIIVLSPVRLRATGTESERTVEQHAARGVDADLAVQLVVRERQLYRLPDLLLLDVQPADVLRATGHDSGTKLGLRV